MSPKSIKDAIHTNFVTLIGKWTIVGGWVKYLSERRVKVGETRNFRLR